MGMTMAYGKVLSYSGDGIGLKSIVTYKDQNGNESKINIANLIGLAKKTKVEDNKRYLEEWIPPIENNNLQIGVVIIDLLNRVVNEFGLDKMKKAKVF